MTPSERLAAAETGLAVGPAERRAFLRATGPDALDFLHRMSTQDLNRLVPGEAVHAAFLTARGHLLGEGTVLRRDGDVLLSLAPEAGKGTRDHLERLVIMDDVTFEDLSGAWVALPVFGPRAAVALAAAAAGDLPRVAVARRGAPCVEGWLGIAEAERVSAALLDAGAVALSREDLEVLRIAAGVARWGADMDEGRLPMEAGLTRDAISFTKGCYVGQELVMRATARGHLQRGLVQLSLPAGASPGAKLFANGQEMGAVTSAADTPGGRVGLGYVKRVAWPEGTRLATEGGEAVVMRPVVWEPEG